MSDDQSRRCRLAAEAAIFQREENALFGTFCALKSLYSLRRATAEEQKFWNHFWYAWERKNHTNAMRQAFADMAKDPYFPSVSYDINPDVFTFCNFERFVANDTNKYVRIVDAIWNLHYVDLTQPFSLLDSCLQNKGVDYPLDPADTERMYSGLCDHETIRLVLTQKYILAPPASAVKDGNAECEGGTPDGNVASNDSVQAKNGPEEVQTVEITPEELERRKRNAEALRLRMLERAAKREKKEAARREKWLKEEERRRVENERRRELEDYEVFLKIHQKRMRSEPRYRWAYKDQKEEEFIELKAKVEEALKLVQPQQTETECKRIKKTSKTARPQSLQAMPQPQPEEPLPPQAMPQPQPEEPLPPQPMPQPQPEEPQLPQAMPQPQPEEPLPPQAMPQPQPEEPQPLQPMPQPQLEEPQPLQRMPQPQPEEPLPPQAMPQPQPEEPQPPQAMPQPQLEEQQPLQPMPQPQPEEPQLPQPMPQPQLEEPMPELPTSVAPEPEIQVPDRQEEKMTESGDIGCQPQGPDQAVREVENPETEAAEHNIPEEKGKNSQN